MAFFTSFTDWLTSVPISNSTTVVEDPSLAVELMLRTPGRVRTEDSTNWVIWFSISVGAAPGWLMVAMTTGNSMSGLSCTSMRMKAIRPAIVRPMNSTIGGTGFRMDQAEMLRKFMRFVPIRLD